MPYNTTTNFLCRVYLKIDSVFQVAHSRVGSRGARSQTSRVHIAPNKGHHILKKGESSVPSLVELSFQHDLDRGKDRVENSVLIKAWEIFTKLRRLKWVNKNQSTKTQYVYDYANFCGSG
jgi:hypothetical protein